MANAIRTDGRKRNVRHHLKSKRLSAGDARILAAVTAVRPPLVVSFRLERDAEPFNSTRVAGLVEDDPGNADARKVSLGNESLGKR